MSVEQTKNIIRFWAAIDLCITGILAMPFTAKLFVTVVYSLNELVGGTGIAPHFDAIHWLFICFTGGMGVLWAVVRLRQPSVFNSKADAVARAWMTLLLLYFVFVADAPIILLLFVATEAIGSIHQFAVLRKLS